MTVPRRAAPPGARTARPAPLPLVAALVAAWPVCLPLGAQAQEATEPVVPLEPVVISVDRREQRSFDAPAAVSTVDARTVREAGPQVNLSESLVRVPGISVLNRQNYAQDLQLSVRGFGARSTFGIRGVRLIVDGIPATMPDGQGQASTISLPSVERIEVLRGPMAQLHGNAAGGVVLVSSRVGAERPTVTFDSVFAPWDTQKVGLTVAMTEGDHAFLIDASQLQTGGWRDHSEASRGQANLRWRWQVDADTRLDLVVNALDQRALDPLGLTRAQWEADPQQAPAIASVQDPRKTVRQEQAGAVLQHRLSPATSLQARLYTGERSLRNALSVPVANQQSVTSSGGIVEFVRPYDGLGLLALHRIALEDAADGRARSLRLGVGLEQDRMREDRQGYVNNGGVRGILKRDEDNLVRNRDLFAQLGWDLRGDLTLDAGVRRSQVRFRTQDRFIIPGPPTNPDDSGSLSYAATLPVLGLAWRASADLNVYANVGRGFETPTFTELAYRSGGLTGLNTDLKPGRSRHAEVGTKWRVAPRQRLDLAVFDIRTSDDLVVDTNTGGRTTFRNATRTRRSGVELGWSADWGPTLSSQVSATVLRAVFDAPFTSGTTTVNAGQRLPGVPAHNAFAGLDWRPRQAWGGFNGGVEVVRQGRIAVNDANTDTAPAATLLNLRAGFGQKAGGWELRQDLRLENATDERYAGSVIVNEGNQRFFEPAMPRSVMLRLSATLRQ